MARPCSPLPYSMDRPESLDPGRHTQRSNLKVLSLDGGGIRGLSMLIILEVIFRLLNSRREQAKPPLAPIEPYEYFDLIGGTSTGGGSIIALMLGRLRMTLKQCKEEYLKLGEEVFGDKHKFWHRNRFDATKLEAVLQRIISRQLTSHEGVPGRKDAPLIDPRRDHCCKTVVYTVSYVNANPVEAVGLRTYHSAHDTERNFTIWQAARATSAAPTFFKRLVVPEDGNSHWVDGGLNVNNPAALMLSETKRIWGDDHQRMDLSRIGIFLTLGTGVAKNASLETSFLNELTTIFGVPEKLIKAIVQTTFDTEGPNQQLLSRFNESPEISQVYHRFNVDRSLRDIEFFEYKKVKHIREYTEDYLRRQEMVQKLNDCVQQAMIATVDPNLNRESQSISETSLSALIKLLRTKTMLLKPVQDYYDHLTIEALEVYDAIYVRLPKDHNGYVSFANFVSIMTNFGPTLQKLEDIWNRMRGGPNACMPRNLMLCILYMTHVECFDKRFGGQRPPKSEDGQWAITDARFTIAKSFGNWVECRFHPRDAWCGRHWSYANHQWGMCRGLETDVECLLWQWYVRRVESWYKGGRKYDWYRVTMSQADHKKAKTFRDECREKWLAHSESFRYPLKD